MKIKAQPSAISRICHHANEWWLLTVTVGSVKPVVLGTGADEFVEDGTRTNSERQMPNPGITSEDPLQFADTQDPARNTWVELEHAKQWLGPEAEQLEQLESQAWHDEVVWSKNWDLLHVGRQRPDMRTGRLGGHVEHWLKDGPEQLAQSGWHLLQAPEEVKVPVGQVETHWPEEASWLDVQVRQKSAEPRQVPQDDEHAIQLYVSRHQKWKQQESYLCRSSYLEMKRRYPKDNSQHIFLVIGRIRVNNRYTGVEQQ